MNGGVASAAQRRSFTIATAVAVALCAVLALVLTAGSSVAGEAASSAGLLVAVLAVMASCGWRASRTSGRRRRSWSLFTAAAATALASNVVGAVVGVDNVGSPSVVTDLVLVPAMLLSIAGLATFPSAPRRSADHVVIALDGVVTGGGVMAIAAVLVYPELLASPTGDGLEQLTILLFPVLDIVLVTMALLLVLRAGGPDRPSLLLIAGGFLAYAATDLGFAVLKARDAYVFGGLLDLGWIVGYLAISLAALYPNPIKDEPEPRSGLTATSTRSAVLVFTVIIAAGIVQVWFGEQLEGWTARLWLVLVVAAGARQTLLAADNASLRRGLERRVREQTADLRRLARETEVLLTSVGDGIYGVDGEGRITFVNPAGVAALGVGADELRGRSAHDAFHVADGEGDDRCYVTDVIRTGRAVTAVEDAYLGPGGEAFPVEVTASPIVDGDTRGAVVAFRDVTQRREVDRMKDEFLSVVSHELRTPLTSIRGSLGLLAGGAVGELNPRAGSMVSIAVESSERLTRLIDDLLDLERIDSGTRSMHLTVVDAHELVSAAVQQIDGMAAPAGVRLQVGPCSGSALADRDQVMQTLTNLLGNAIKYSDPGGLVVADVTERDGELLFRVIDEGRGIPADKLDSIFERFFQVDSSDTRQQGGTGLGLAISRTIVERHGGRIWAESREGAGTTVLFTLPATRPPRSAGSPSSGPAVLVCDDDPAVVDDYSALLREGGYRAVGLTDGGEALARIRAERPVAVVLDLMRPGTSGAQVLAALKGDEELSRVPVLVVSERAPEEDVRGAVLADEWLVRPVTQESLAGAVARAVTARGLETRSAPDGPEQELEPDPTTRGRS